MRAVPGGKPTGSMQDGLGGCGVASEQRGPDRRGTRFLAQADPEYEEPE